MVCNTQIVVLNLDETVHVGLHNRFCLLLVGDDSLHDGVFLIVEVASGFESFLHHHLVQIKFNDLLWRADLLLKKTSLIYV